LTQKELPKVTQKNDKRTSHLYSVQPANVDKGNDSKTAHFCVLASLLSSVVIFNTIRDFNNHSLSQLGAMAGIIQCVKGLDACNSKPDLFILLRDSALVMAIDKQPCSAESYVNHIFAERLMDDTHNSTRCAIKRLFTQISLVETKRPYCTKGNEIWTCQMVQHQPFLDSIRLVKERIFNGLKPKVMGTQILDGNALWDLCESVINLFNSEDDISIESLLDGLSRGIVQRALEQAQAYLEEKISTIDLEVGDEGLIGLTMDVFKFDALNIYDNLVKNVPVEFSAEKRQTLEDLCSDFRKTLIAGLNEKKASKELDVSMRETELAKRALIQQQKATEKAQYEFQRESTKTIRFSHRPDCHVVRGNRTYVIFGPRVNLGMSCGVDNGCVANMLYTIPPWNG